ncbi:MAG TPA: hypothetical protein VGM82_10370 [Gemmatimonadaceae bacterium]|jgi:hypothetical protein
MRKETLPKHESNDVARLHAKRDAHPTFTDALGCTLADDATDADHAEHERGDREAAKQHERKSTRL